MYHLIGVIASCYNINMSKTIISILIIGAVAVGGYFLSKSNKGGYQETKGETNVEVSKEEATKPNGKKIAFSEFIKQSGSYKCTVNQSLNNTVTKGTTYLSNGMIRGEYNTKVSGMSVDSTILVRDGYTYSWNSMMPSMGFKMKVQTTTNTPNVGASASGSYSFNAEQIGDYDCQAWTVDQSKFAVPTTITFKEMSSVN